MRPDMLWIEMEGDLLELVQPSLRLLGIDENGELYVSAEYGRDTDEVIIERYLDGEPRVYRWDIPFVRVNWLVKRFPQSLDMFKSFDLPFV